MNIIRSLHWRVYKFAWRLSFAARMMEKLRCSLPTGLRRADEAMKVVPNWYDQHPKELADKRARMYLK